MPRTRRDFQVTQGVESRPQKVVIYGSGGVGKTKLCSLVSEAGISPLILDLEAGSSFLPVRRVPADALQTWDDLRDALHSESLWQGTGAVVIDSMTKAEELAVAWTLANVKKEKGGQATGVEDYGWGKGYTNVYETFNQLLQDLDAHTRKGRHVLAIAHECTANVPNPEGEDWIRYEPRLQTGKASIRHRVKEWADHLLFVSYDKAVEDGKAKGGGSRTIHPIEYPMWMAKSRTLADDIIYEDGSAELWNQLFNTK